MITVKLPTQISSIWIQFLFLYFQSYYCTHFCTNHSNSSRACSVRSYTNMFSTKLKFELFIFKSCAVNKIIAPWIITLSINTTFILKILKTMIKAVKLLSWLMRKSVDSMISMSGYLQLQLYGSKISTIYIVIVI